MKNAITYMTPMNRFRFVRSIKNHDQALYAEKIFNQISFTSEELEDLKTLHRYSTTLHRLNENACNGWPKPVVDFRNGGRFQFSVEDVDWRARDEKKEAKINKSIEEISAKYGWKIELQGDPRGWPMKLLIKTDSVNEIDASVLVNYR